MNVARITIDLLLAVLWSAAFICMVLPKGMDLKYALSTPPYGPWIAAIVLSTVEGYVLSAIFHARFKTLTSPHLDSMCFTYSTILVIREQYNVGSMDDQCAISLILSLLTCGNSTPNVNLGLVGSQYNESIVSEV